MLVGIQVLQVMHIQSLVAVVQQVAATDINLHVRHSLVQHLPAEEQRREAHTATR